MGSSAGLCPRFQRKTLTISSAKPLPPVPLQERRSALVINSSHDMARAISKELHEKMPSFSLLYAPTIQIAKLILSRRKVDLILASAMLPDGSITTLVPTLQGISNSPDLVVIGSLDQVGENSILNSGYSLNTVFPLAEEPEPPAPLESKVRELGADLRDRLNNPLQEIVAMAFVAQATPSAAPSTIEALSAIQNAARNMAGVVNKLEENIREVIIDRKT